MKFFREKGEGRGSLVLGIVVLLLAAYIGLKVIPVMVRVYAFEDRVREECKFLHGRNTDQLTNDILDAAELEKLQIDEENIDAKKIRVDTYEVLRVNIIYTVAIATPVHVFNWNRVMNYEAPIFE
jgi:hypothetical protein